MLLLLYNIYLYENIYIYIVGPIVTNVNIYAQTTLHIYSGTSSEGDWEIVSQTYQTNDLKCDSCRFLHRCSALLG